MHADGWSWTAGVLTCANSSRHWPSVLVVHANAAQPVKIDQKQLPNCVGTLAHSKGELVLVFPPDHLRWLPCMLRNQCSAVWILDGRTPEGQARDRRDDDLDLQFSMQQAGRYSACISGRRPSPPAHLFWSTQLICCSLVCDCCCRGYQLHYIACIFNWRAWNFLLARTGLQAPDHAKAKLQKGDCLDSRFLVVLFLRKTERIEFEVCSS